MRKVQDFDAEYTVYSGDKEVRKFKGNLWTLVESYRLIFGPGTSNTSAKLSWQDKEVSFVDYVNWENPTCCGTCKQQAEYAKTALEENPFFQDHHH